MSRIAGSVLKLAGLLLIFLGGYALLHWMDLSALTQPTRVVDLLLDTGPLAPLLFIILMAAAVVISPLPSLPLDLAAGATFGILPGTAYALVGAEVGAIISFLIGRALGRKALTRIFRIEIRFCERCSDRHLVVFIFLARLFPVFSFDLISYGAGLTNMSLRAFAVATLLGMIAPTFLLTYVGGSMVSSEWLLILLGLIMVALFLLLPRLVIRYQSAWWVRLLRGDMPVAATALARRTPLIRASEEAVRPCASCGASLEETHDACAAAEGRWPICSEQKEDERWLMAHDRSMPIKGGKNHG